MRCFTLDEDGLHKSISTKLDPQPHVPIGEWGQRRYLERVLIGERFQKELIRTVNCPHWGRKVPAVSGYCLDCTVELGRRSNRFVTHPNEGTTNVILSLTQARPIRTKADGRLLIVEEYQDEPSALVHLNLRPNRGGEIRYSYDDRAVTMLAQGRVALGENGRAGTAPAFLAEMRENSYVTARRSAGTPGVAGELIHLFWRGARMVMEKETESSGGGRRTSSPPPFGDSLHQ